MRRSVLGGSRLKVSALGLGTSNWGIQVSEDVAERLLRIFLVEGGNLVDTADIYGVGVSETILGRLVTKLDVRDEVVIATKAGLTLAGPAQPPDASYEHLCSALDESLRKLSVDYVDLWQVHEWDSAVPMEETLAALDWAVSSGRARYAGVSNYSGSQTVDTLAWQAAHDQPGIASLQTEYSLLNRSRETEISVLSTDHGLGIIAWGALGRGVLTGKYQSGAASRPGATEFFDNYIAPLLNEESARVVAAVVDVARELGCAPAAVAAAWVLCNPAVDAALVGASTENQLSGSLMGGMLTLPDDAVALLDDVSRLPVKP